MILYTELREQEHAVYTEAKDPRKGSCLVIQALRQAYPDLLVDIHSDQLVAIYYCQDQPVRINQLSKVFFENIRHSRKKKKTHWSLL